ncbi:MAG: radical SAM protein [Nitrospirae bacterium]|nr:radical SAM protein [Nitrospirota bacterium]
MCVPLLQRGNSNIPPLTKGGKGGVESSVDIQCLLNELKETLDMVKTGRLFSFPPFDKTPPELRHLSDIAVSGDGEPTTFPHFYEVVRDIIEMKNSMSDNIKLVVITNSSGLNRQKVQDALDLLYENNGEVWAKLDAGSDTYYKKISRTNIPFENIIRNITVTSKRHPIIIQSCFNKIYKLGPSVKEIGEYIKVIKKIAEEGGQVRFVQIYTTARPPSEGFVTPLPKDELSSIAEKLSKETGIPAEIFT